MSDIRAGDVVVCVDARDCRTTWEEDSGRLRRGAHYRVRAIVCGGAGVRLCEVPAVNPSGFWIDRFRKIEAPRTEISERIRKCRPIKIGADA